MPRPRIDISGQKFGKLTVIKYTMPTIGKSGYLCLCECGNETMVARKSLISGNTKTCGCSHNYNPLKEGDVFGRLTVVSYAGKAKYNHKKWRCKCECGNSKVVYQTSLLRGLTVSCGCYYNERRELIPYTGHKELSGTHWANIKSNAQKRGICFEITIEDAYEVFERQNGKCNLSGLSISLKKEDRSASLDRIDSDKGYTKDNIQWIHKQLNTMKMALSVDDFIHWCSLVSLNSKKKKLKEKMQYKGRCFEPIPKDPKNDN